MLARAVIVAAMTLCLTLSARGAGNYGEMAPEFPPGAFTDGQKYQLSDFAGKVVVLFFYEKDCPGCRRLIPQRNEVVRQYEGKPVKFFAVAAGDTLPQARSYAGSTRLAMPVFADSLSLMERRYGMSISLQNIYQFRVIGPDGKVAGYRMEPADIDKALQRVQLKYDPEQYHPRLRPALEMFEWNQHAAGMKLLRPMLNHADAELAASANKLLESIKEEANEWLSEADAAAEEDPLLAFDLYSKVSSALMPDELAKQAAEKARKLQTHEQVKAELEARKMFERVSGALAAATPKPADAIKFAAEIVRKYPDTPTGQKAQALQAELGG